MTRGFGLWICLLCSTVTAKDPVEIQSLDIFPQKFTLTGQRERLQLVVVGALADGSTVDLTRHVSYRVGSAGAVSVSQSGQVAMLENGSATIVAQYGQHNVEAQVTAQSEQPKQKVSFDYHVLPVLAQSGCSGGSCHGSPHGKGGFRLSLFASDSQLDRNSLSRQWYARRINRIDPAGSLLLRKPTMQIAHQGGKRFDVESTQYNLLHDWIAEGAATSDTGPECLGIEVSVPGGHLIRFPHRNRQISVMAKFSDGSIRDVTHLAKYELSDASIADVSREGWITALDRGQSAVITRYLHFIEAPLLTLVRDVDGFAWSDPPAANYIDEKVYEKLQQLQYAASPLCEDHEFVRRVYLDVTGSLPTTEQAQQFLNNTSDHRRGELIDQLLSSRAYVRFWAQKWGDLLRVSTKLIGRGSVYKFNRWLEHCVANNMPYDEFVRQILLAQGSTLQNPAGNFYRSAGDTSDATETAAQVFMGTRIQCAKCHNHPFERWTQANYYGLSVFFHRLQRSGTSRDGEVFLWSAPTGDVINPATGEHALPWAPGTEDMQLTSDDPRGMFADWLTRPENPLFAKIEVNRIWAHVMGRGIVEPFDDFRDSNPPSNSSLLDALAADFVQHQYDREHILRKILNSRTYQASAYAVDLNKEDSQYFSHYQTRMLSAEQLVDALGAVTGKPQSFHGVPAHIKATWLPAPDLKPHDRAKIGEIEFLKVFGQPERQSACECERGKDVSLGQALELLNGKLVGGMLSDKSNVIHRELAAGKEPNEIIRGLYMRALCRQPSEAELRIHGEYLRQSEDVGIALEDICWAILNRNEFLFQH